MQENEVDDAPIAPSSESADAAPERNDVSSEPEGYDEKFVSQAELDRIVKKRLKRQEEQLLKKYADYDQLSADAEAFRKIQDEKSTDAERWERERDQLLSSLKERDEKLTRLERANLIADLASEKGLPKSFWKRVQGDSPEDIAEDMDSIIKDLGIKADRESSKEKTPSASRSGSFYGGGGETVDPDPDTDSIVSKIPRGPQIRVDKPRAYK